MEIMDDSFKKEPENPQRKLEERREHFDDRTIGSAWTALADTQASAVVTTKTGLALSVRRNVIGLGKVEYRAFLPESQAQVAWMQCRGPLDGRVLVANANVYEVGGKDHRRQGIATAIYELIESDVRTAGGEGVEPHWGSMNGEAMEFWRKRGPEHAEETPNLNELCVPLSGRFD
jgi:hypothetical protein